MAKGILDYRTRGVEAAFPFPFSAGVNALGSTAIGEGSFPPSPVAHSSAACAFVAAPSCHASSKPPLRGSSKCVGEKSAADARGGGIRVCVRSEAPGASLVAARFRPTFATWRTFEPAWITALSREPTAFPDTSSGSPSNSGALSPCSSSGGKTSYWYPTEGLTPGGALITVGLEVDALAEIALAEVTRVDRRTSRCIEPSGAFTRRPLAFLEPSSTLTATNASDFLNVIVCRNCLLPAELNCSPCMHKT
jgi:hypothetical protein